MTNDTTRAPIGADAERAAFDRWLGAEMPAGCVSDMERGWMARAALANAAQPAAPTYEPCGGCAEDDPAKRCIGCMHPFAAAPKAAPAQQPAATVIKKGADRQWMSECLGRLPDGIYSLYLAPTAQPAPAPAAVAGPTVDMPGPWFAAQYSGYDTQYWTIKRRNPVWRGGTEVGMNGNCNPRRFKTEAAAQKAADELNAARPAPAAQGDALDAIRQAIRDYHFALDSRRHGDVAAGEALSAIERALCMQWVQGAEAAARAAKEGAPDAPR